MSSRLLGNSLSLLRRCFYSNFIVEAGFSPKTKNTEVGNRKLFLLDEQQYLTYSDVNFRCGRIAECLSSIYKIGKGDVVLCRTTKNVSVFIYLAVLRLGAIYVPLNPSYTVPETQHFVENSQPKLFVTCNRDNDTIFNDVLNGSVVDEKLVMQQSSLVGCLLDVENMEDNDVATILYTSGTTGKPKGAALSHGAICRNAEALVDCFKFTASDVLLHTLPFFHIHGMFLSFHCTLFSKSSTIFLPKFNIIDVLRYLPQSTVFSGVPSHYSRLLGSNKFTRDLVSNVRLFISGSASMTPILFEKFREQTGGFAILQRYAMTEAMAITSMPYTEERYAESVGRPLPGTQLRISEDGVVEVKSNSLFNGYWREPEKTKEEFTSDGYFRTGDLGYIDDKGFLYLNGRQKDLIISGGLNVYPKEVEGVIDLTHLVQEAAIIGVPHPDFGEAVVAVCARVNDSTSDQQTIESIEKILIKKMAPYKRPKKWILVSELPRNAMGKILKNVLRDTYKNLFV